MRRQLHGFELCGPRRKGIIELAPLLFTLLAEASLAWRRQRLEEVGAVMERLSDLGKMSQLYFANHSHQTLEDGLHPEEVSIEAADLRGDKVRDEGDGTWFPEDWLYAVTPFADYLRKLAKDLKISRKVDFFPETALHAAVGESDMIWGAEPYQVCRSKSPKGGDPVQCVDGRSIAP